MSDIKTFEEFMQHIGNPAIEAVLKPLLKSAFNAGREAERERENRDERLKMGDRDDERV